MAAVVHSSMISRTGYGAVPELHESDLLAAYKAHSGMSGAMGDAADFVSSNAVPLLVGAAAAYYFFFHKKKR